MVGEYSKIIKAWEYAARELGIKINTDFRLDNSFKSYLHIEEFGSPKGTIVLLTIDEAEFKKLKETDYHLSIVSSKYSVYDKQLFIDTLNDWGNYGRTKPSWYSGQSWTS